jgi:transcriptional regulator with XRE-family HTH domain
MGDKYQQKQHERLGKELRNIRVQLRESMAEVSGSVEIDIDDLAQFESGELRPSEEILLLLISHFDLDDGRAAKLWDLAGYSKDSTQPESEEDMHRRLAREIDEAGVFVAPSDVKVIYTDMAHMVAGKHGVIINFMQSVGPMGKPMIVSRVGMSREHARNIMELLQKATDESDQSPRLLGAPESPPQDK